MVFSCSLSKILNVRIGQSVSSPLEIVMFITKGCLTSGFYCTYDGQLSVFQVTAQRHNSERRWTLADALNEEMHLTVTGLSV